MDINKKLYTAIKNSMLGKYFVYVVQIATLMILSRLFSPEIFGQLVLLQALTMFFQMLSTTGLGPAVVYQDTISAEDRDGMFTFSCMIGFFMAVFFAVLMFGYDSIYGITNNIIYFFAISVFFSSLSMLPLALLQKDSFFRRISVADVISELVTFSICIFLYYLKFELIALAIKIILTPLFRFLGYYYFSIQTATSRPFFGAKVKAIYPLLSFAKDQLIFNVFVYFSRNLDTILIAKYFSVTALGFYEKTYQVVRYPLQLFTFAINPALQPVLTKYKDNPSLVMVTYYKLVFKMMFIGCAFATLIFMNASEIVYLMFGPQWSESVSILQILCLSIPIQMILSSTGGIFQAFGATKTMLKCGFFSGSLNVLAIVAGVYFRDLEMLCVFLLAAYLMNFVQCFYMLHRHVFNINLGINFIILFSMSVLPFSFMLIDISSDANNLNYLNSFYILLTNVFFVFIVFIFLYFISNFLLKKMNFKSENK
jgi:PST family polysaccharide transporter